VDFIVVKNGAVRMDTRVQSGLRPHIAVSIVALEVLSEWIPAFRAD